MKDKEKSLAKKLRKNGLSLNEIKRKLNVSKSSVSLWVRDIILTHKQRQKLSKKGVGKEVIEKRRETRLKRENHRRQIIVDKAKSEISKLSKKELWLGGISLYWGEGSKTIRSGVQFSNADPRAIKFMMLFFKKCCKVPKKKFRGHIFLHSHLNDNKAKRYWHYISGIPLSQFYKTSQQQNKPSKKRKIIFRLVLS